MSERYSRLFTLPENLYAVGSPVVIAAGTLLKDNQTGKIVAQLKLRSISPKVIIGLKVKLSLFDNAGNPLGMPVDFDYLDLNASRDAEFGQKVPVPVAERKTRSYTVTVQNVIFADRSTWVASGEEWECLPIQRTLDEVFSDSELIKQFKITVGNNCAYYPAKEKDLWYCACGALNHENENCHVCNKKFSALQDIDMGMLITEKEARLEEEAKRAAEIEYRNRNRSRKTKYVISTISIAVAIYVLLTTVIIPSSIYKKAVSLAKCDDKRDIVKAAIMLSELGDYRDSQEKCIDFWHRAVDCETISAGHGYTMAIKLDGTTVNAGYYDIGEWNDYNIRSVNAGSLFALVLFDNGEVASGQDWLLAGRLYDTGAIDVDDWSDIVDIDAGDLHSVGLKKDGTVVATGVNDDGRCDVDTWTDIMDVSAGASHTVGLKIDGTVVATGSNQFGQCNLDSWTDIVSIDVGSSHTVGLKADGTVVAVGSNDYGECDLGEWKNIIAVSAGVTHTVGLKADGTVVAVGRNLDGECNTHYWKNIVAVSAGSSYTLGLRKDGTVVAVGDKSSKEVVVPTYWKNVRIPD